MILLMSIFGTRVAIIYVVVGLVIAVVGGSLIEKMHMEPYVEEFIKTAGSVDIESPSLTKKERLTFAKEQVPVYSDRRGHWRNDPQLDSGELGGGCPGK